MSDTADESPASQAARECADDIGAVGAMFMLDMDNHVAAAAAGYEGLAFYFGGRGGVLGDVPVAAVVKAFCFFPSASVEAGWTQAIGVETRHEAAVRFARAAETWAASHLPTDGIGTRGSQSWPAGSPPQPTARRLRSSTDGVRWPSPGRRANLPTTE
ncbi:MAG: hypothetical protein IPQ14_15265 [Candidatus Microthrix sp.]|nr:hypothetical protein [Candidatus Microthrix sp.]MBL0205636.1 hypothetical protein [Candidatus Microthrix sp.]